MDDTAGGNIRHRMDYGNLRDWLEQVGGLLCARMASKPDANGARLAGHRDESQAIRVVPRTLCALERAVGSYAKSRSRIVLRPS